MAKWIATFLTAVALGAVITWSRTAEAEHTEVDDTVVNAKIDARLHELLTQLAQRQGNR